MGTVSTAGRIKAGMYAGVGERKTCGNAGKRKRKDKKAEKRQGGASDGGKGDTLH